MGQDRGHDRTGQGTAHMTGHDETGDRAGRTWDTGQDRTMANHKIWIKQIVVVYHYDSMIQ